MSKKIMIALIVWFYLGWFGCIYFAKWGLENFSLLFPLFPFTYFLKAKLFSNKELIFFLGAAIVGILFDSSAYFAKLIQFENHQSGFIPVWLISMWFLFVSVLALSHAFFQSRLWLAAALGAVFGPLSYLSGEAFQVFSFTSQLSILIYAIFWAVYFPAMHYIYRKIA